MFRKRFERAVKDCDLSKNTDCKELARYVATLLNGLAVQAASGTSEKDLCQVVATAMRDLAVLIACEWSPTALVFC